jgi:hypothetical protein
MLRLHDQPAKAAFVPCTNEAYFLAQKHWHTSGGQEPPVLEEIRAMANVTYTARPYMPGQIIGDLLGRFVTATYDFAIELRDAYAAERKAQKLAQATRHLDRRLLRDIGLDLSAS